MQWYNCDNNDYYNNNLKTTAIIMAVLMTRIKIIRLKEHLTLSLKEFGLKEKLKEH